MYAIFDRTHKQVTKPKSTKTAAWTAHLIAIGAETWGYRRDVARKRAGSAGYYCERASVGSKPYVHKAPAKPKAKATAAPAVLKFETKAEKSIVLDLNFTKGMHKFFKDKQNKGEIQYIYEYKSYGSEGDAKKLLEHMIEFLSGYTAK